MTPEQFAQLFSLGIGGIIAGVVLYWKRDDDKAWRTRETAHATELSKLNETLVKVLTNNTRALNTLSLIVRGSRAHADPADIDVTETHE